MASKTQSKKSTPRQLAKLPAKGSVKSSAKASAKASERRVHKRVPINIWVREERGNYYFLYKATDISEMGMFLEKKIDNPCPEAQSLFKFTLPKSSRLITVVGNTIFSNTSSMGSRPGSGIRFLNVNNQDKKLLVKYINQF